MKRLSFIILGLSLSVALFAKDIKTVVVTTLPQMQCASCVNKIKGNLRFEKGVKEIECDIPKQRVTITYDAEKNTPENIIQSFGKFGYQATEVKPEPVKKVKVKSSK